jgi:pSer/pThr/pTyr-binding forkhead associated (FHA) protein
MSIIKWHNPKRPAQRTWNWVCTWHISCWLADNLHRSADGSKLQVIRGTNLIFENINEAATLSLSKCDSTRHRHPQDFGSCS